MPRSLIIPHSSQQLPLMLYTGGTDDPQELQACQNSFCPLLPCGAPSAPFPSVKTAKHTSQLV